MNTTALQLKLHAFLSSKLFFRIIMGFFIVSSVYVALVSLYPMAFDENFHIGLIQIYAQHWLPLPAQTPSTDVYGAITADPSYFYHYLMSFPYRLLHQYIGSESVIIVLLRVMNISFCVAALFIFRRLLREAKVSPAIINVTFAFFVLIPVVPLLAGQVNYDNLLMLLIAFVFLFSHRIYQGIVHEKRTPVSSLFWLIIVLTYTAIVKYAFLPIAAAIVGYLLYVFIRATRHDKRIARQLVGDTKRLSKKQKVLFSAIFVLGLILFSQRYVLNVVNYHHPIPDCAVVLNETRCQAYGPWGRDYHYEQNKEDVSVKGPLAYTAQDWSWGMWHRLFFTLAGPTNNYQTQRQLPVPSGIAIVLFFMVVIATVIGGRRVLRKYPVFVPVLIVTTVYIAALWSQQYQSYTQTGQPVAINGRYLVPLLPLLGAFSLLVLLEAARKLKVTTYAAPFACVILLLFLQGGGPITYIVRSNPSWFWQDALTQDVTNTLRSTLKPVVIGD